MAHKYEILSQINETHPDLRHEVAAKHGGALYDLFCRTPRCDGKVLGHWVQVGQHRGWSAEVECRYVVCDKCAVRGNWDVKASIPPSLEQVLKAKKTLESQAQAARREEIKALDDQIARLHKRRSELLPELLPKQSEPEPEE